MACIENIPPGNDESEMEEGEIVDDLDELSDISSEEEFLLRQRLQVLENYNNVLERKKAKNSSSGPGKRKEDSHLHDLSEISATDLEETLSHVASKTQITVYRNLREQKHVKSHHKQKKRKVLEPHNLGKAKEHKKKAHRKKRLEVKIISETSDESDDEYRNKRRKLANAVVVNKYKNDKTSLHDRLQKMICGTKPVDAMKSIPTLDKQTETTSKVADVSCSPLVPLENSETNDVPVPESLEVPKEVQQECELVDLCTDEDTCVAINDTILSKDTVDSVIKEKSDNENKNKQDSDSDEDLELLRQHALNTKALKTKPEQKEVPTVKDKPHISEDEDSDTAELRLICLKSALLKKAIEMKQKQKLRKRLSQSSNLQDSLLNDQDELLERIQSSNNTDIESVDMDMGSDTEENEKDLSHKKNTIAEHEQKNDEKSLKLNTKDDELEEDEDLLRAKLLTSLSKNLPNLVDPSIVNTVVEENVRKEKVQVPKTQDIPPEKRIIINLGESDSEGEHEATKNLTKMHIKLSEQIDFQQKLDMFLKSTRMEVEKSNLPDIVQKPVTTPEKFVAKTVNHLPKTEQIEYKNLVKRMEELQKIKEARQSTMNLLNKQTKDTLKPRNAFIDTTKTIANEILEEQITLSRKKIAEESVKMMKLKEEATKLTQKYNIVATELKNIATAITLNKKEQRFVHTRLSKIRTQHQRLLNSSTNKHSKTNGNLLTVNRSSNKVLMASKPQKENNPSNEEYKNSPLLNSAKIPTVNDKLNDESLVAGVTLSAEVDSSSNKTVRMSNVLERVVYYQKNCDTNDNIENWKESVGNNPVVEKGGGDVCGNVEINAKEKTTERRKEFDDYESPLDALKNANWEADPNAILCPFEVGGNCKDPDCKYLHPKMPTK